MNFSNTLQTTAAECLTGIDLPGGWTVGAMIPKPPGATGSFFSVCYEVFKDGQRSFLKAFNIVSFFKAHSGKGSLMEILGRMTETHNYERDLSQLCRDHHVSKVSVAVDSGEVVVPGHAPIDVVPYLIFDWADGDIRGFINFSGGLDDVAKLKSLHSIAVGMKQLHSIQVSHNDLKPSNVLVFPTDHKVGDLGSSICGILPSPNEKYVFGGDMRYAPPEVLYNAPVIDRRAQAHLIDLYLCGSMITFYFTGFSMSALLLDNLPRPFHLRVWSGTFEDVKQYLVDAFAIALDKLSKSVEPSISMEIAALVAKLGYPLPELRGLGKPTGKPTTALTLERLVSSLDLIHLKARYRFLRKP